MTSFKKILLKILVAACLIGGVSVAAFSYAADKPNAKSAASAPGAATPAMPVIVAPVVKKNITHSISAVGSLLASESADIHSETAGKIEKIHFVEGAIVKKGDVLLEIDNSLIKTDFAKAEAAYRVAAATLGRDSKLYSSKYISTQELDESKANLQQKKAEMDSARIRLEKTRVIAPFDGLVGLRSFSIGDYVEIGKVLTTIDAYDPIKIEFAVPERNFADIQIGQTLSFQTDAWPNTTFQGEIYAIDSRVNPQTRSVQVKALASNSENKLRSGMYARISIQTNVAEGSLVIPEEAVFSKGSKDFVFVVQDGKAVTREIKIQSRQENAVAVQSGLQEGDSVIAAGVQRVRDGMTVIATTAQK